MSITASEVMKIERTTLIDAPRARVWRALTTPQDFSKFFAVELEGSFAPGKRLEMISQKPCEGAAPHFYLIVERMEPEHTFSWRWHPGGTSIDEDGSTLVEFHLEEIKGRTRVTVTETGFDRISLERRAKALARNQAGWEVKLRALEEYVTQTQ